MGGIAWEALPIVIELLGVVDVEKFVEQLVTIRDHQNRGANSG